MGNCWTTTQVLACGDIMAPEKTMNLESYFDFLSANDIRLKGHRIGIETILYDYIYREKTPEQIARRYPTLTLQQVYATILYYLHRKERIDGYLADWLEAGRRAREDQARLHPEFAEKLG